MKVENEMDLTPEWASPEHFRHWSRWDRFERGEADQQAEKARRIVGAYPLRRATRPIERGGKVNSKTDHTLAQEER